jgi:uncharacterized protein (TIGR03032 family)
MMNRESRLEEMWARHSAEWREGSQICSQWREAVDTDPQLLVYKASRGWWSTLASLNLTLLITREYEHLVIAATVENGRPRLSFMPIPHPSGLAVDRSTNRVFLASTRNPNQIFTLRPVQSHIRRRDVNPKSLGRRPLAMSASAFFPGSLYMHDLAVVGSNLYANAVGHNAIARLNLDGTFERVWWPLCVERNGNPDFSCNYIQLNSIAAGTTLRSSYFSASSASIGRYRPGHLSYPVDKRGVIFSGKTREPICTGLTRPHSARLRGREVWVANSGYGELGFVSDARLEVVTRLSGWTRGLCIVGDVAFVGTSRVIPRYARYAPGLEVSTSRCAIHAVSCTSGAVLGSLEWPQGNQIFAIDWIPAGETSGFPFEIRSGNAERETAFFYTYVTDKNFLETDEQQ